MEGLLRRRDSSGYELLGRRLLRESFRGGEVLTNQVKMEAFGGSGLMRLRGRDPNKRIRLIDVKY